MTLLREQAGHQAPMVWLAANVACSASVPTPFTSRTAQHSGS